MRAWLALAIVCRSAVALAGLAVPRFGAAAVVEPRAPGPQPVLVVLHGNGDSPDAICTAFDALARGRSWILCPRGIATAGGWTFPANARTVDAEVRAALKALERAFPARVSVDQPALAGFSLGAMHAASLARGDPRAFPRVLIVDTHRVWSQAESHAFTAHGGRAATFACSRTYVADCRRLCGALPELGVARRAVGCVALPDREHGYDRELFERTRASFDRLIADDPRWR